MASTSSSALTISSFSDAKAPPRQSAPQRLTLPTLPPPPLHSQKRPWKTTAYCRQVARNVIAKATGEAPVEVAAGETPEIVKAIQKAWDKVDDKYAVSSLAVAGVVVLWGSAGLIGAIDRLPVIPGALELVGIGYTAWFAYKNLFYKPEREAFLEKVKSTYNDILGSS